MSTVALIMAWHGGQAVLGVDSVPMVIDSIHTALIVFTVLSAVGVFFSLKRGRVR